MAFSTNWRSNWTKLTKAGCHKAACHVLTGDVSCQCQVCEHFLGMAPRDLQFVIPMYFKFDTHIYKTKIDLYVSTLWISDHHAPPNLKQYIAQESCSKPECAFYIIKQRNLDQMHLCICALLHFVNFLNLFCDSYFESPDIFITAAQCYPSMHLFMQFIYIVKLCYKNNKFRTGAETVPIF